MYRGLLQLATLTPLRVASFWEKVERRLPNECWPWRGRRGRAGYGLVYLGPRPGGGQRWVQAHRFSGVLAGKLHALWSPHDGDLARHSCDNPPCVNPDHILAGTHKDNSDDKRRRGRHAHRTTHGSAKLGELDVAEIRSWIDRGVPLTEIARRKAVTHATIYAIAVGKTWRDESFVDMDRAACAREGLHFLRLSPRFHLTFSLFSS